MGEQAWQGGGVRWPDVHHLSCWHMQDQSTGSATIGAPAPTPTQLSHGPKVSGGVNQLPDLDALSRLDDQALVWGGVE